ncbi:hypothetical protein FRC07_006192, partial [Ceratobasidium sp. 392]
MSSQLSEDCVFSPYPGIPGAMTCDALSKYYLGVIDRMNLLCCIRCEKEDRIVNVSTARAHVLKHFTQDQRHLTKKENRRFFLDLCAKFNVRDAQIQHLETPTHGSPPLPFLETYRVERCGMCDERQSFISSATDRRRHFQGFHKLLNIPDEEWPTTKVDAQTFSPKKHNPKTWWEVNPALAVLDPHADEEDEEALGVKPVTPLELAQAYLSEYTPIGMPSLYADGLHDVAPFLHITGWAAEIQKLNVPLLRALVATPANDAPLRLIYNAAVERFRTEQGEIHMQHDALKTALMDEGAGDPKKAIQELSSTTAKDYGRVWGLWVVFLCRLRQMMLEPRPFYPIYFTEAQKAAIDKAIEYCDPDKRTGSAPDILYDLADLFWRPQEVNQFRALATDKFSDATVRFACLINLHEDGTFATPRNASHTLVRIKYMIRSTLFNWSLRKHREEKWDMNDTVKYIAGAVNKRTITPFATISFLVSQASLYAKTSIHLPNVVWSDNNRLSVEGHLLDFNLYRRGLADTIVDLERLISTHLLFGLDASEFGFTYTCDSTIVDNLSDDSMGYSIFNEEKNHFRQLETALANRLFAHREGAGDLIDFKLSTRERIVYRPHGMAAYIEAYHQAVKRLAFCMHNVGGQPARGTEFITLQFANAQFRQRNIYMVGPGKMIYVIYYNKTTSQTGYDYITTHAIPWRLARLVLILRGLVAPFATHLYSKTKKKKRNHQLFYVFAEYGYQITSEQFSDQLCEWFQNTLNAPIRLRLHRQFIIAVQRRYMAAAFEAIRKVLVRNTADSMGGHSTETSEEHYAITAEETKLLKSDTVLKYISVSIWWWRILFGDIDGMLTPIERGDGSGPPDEFAEIPHAHSISGQKEALHTLMVSFFKQGAWGREIAMYIWEKLRELQLVDASPRVGLAAEDAATSDNGDDAGPRYKSIPAERTLLQAHHLRLLQLFCKNDDATWTSFEQGQALAHVINRGTSLLIVLPTGAGKSFLFSAMQYYEKAITVVVFPLRALLQDQIRSAMERNPSQPWHIWKPTLSLTTGIVVTSVEKLADPNFQHWCKAQGKKLSRIAIDECHLVPSSVDFRACMGNLQPIVQSKVPLVCLSATMPPVLEGDLNRCLGNPSWRVIRSGTQRPNLHLRSARYKSKHDGYMGLIDVLDRYLPTLATFEGVLIIARNKEDAKQLGIQLGHPTYHADMTKEERDEVARKWLAGEHQVVIGTSALGTGVHHPHCVLVIHWDVPWGMLAYIQEIGRAGRSGQPALCIVIHWEPRPVLFGADNKAYAQMLDMLEDDEGCMREHQSRYNDGRLLVTSCFTGKGFALCDRCLNHMGKAKSKIQAVIPGLVPVRTGVQYLSPNRPPPNLVPIGAAAQVAPSQLVPPASPPITYVDPEDGDATMAPFEPISEPELDPLDVLDDAPDNFLVDPDAFVDAPEMDTDTEQSPTLGMGELSMHDAPMSTDVPDVQTSVRKGKQRATSVNSDVEMADSWPIPDFGVATTSKQAAPAKTAGTSQPRSTRGTSGTLRTPSAGPAKQRIISQHTRSSSTPSPVQPLQYQHGASSQGEPVRKPLGAQQSITVTHPSTSSAVAYPEAGPSIREVMLRSPPGPRSVGVPAGQ